MAMRDLAAVVACMALLTAEARAQSVRFRWYEGQLDGLDQPYAVVPPRGGGEGPFGLVVGLHGHYGGPGAYCALILGGQVPPPDFVVACPYGYGDTAFRYVGEEDVFLVMAKVADEFPIDPGRVFVTGASDGGVAAYELALHYPDVWAGAMPLAAYGGVTFFPAIGRTGHTPAEAKLIRARSATTWADNALHVPFYVANGARDTWQPRPEETVAHHLARLSYRVENIIYPDLAHDSWTRTYSGGAAFEWFRRFRRPASPERVVFTTADPRYSRSFWVREVLLEAPVETFGRIEAEVRPGQLSVRTSGLLGFSLDPTPAGPLTTVVDGATFPPGAGVRAFRREPGGAWAEGVPPTPAPGAPVKTAGLAGPLSDFRAKPATFVYGTRADGQALEQIATAERDHWTRGLRLRLPVKADSDLTDEERRTRTLVLLGGGNHNRLAAELGERLPVRLREDGRAVLVGATAYAGPGVGFRVIYPSPWAPGQYVVVVGGTDLAGVRTASLLPELQPDWVVAGPEASPKNGRRGMVLGGRRVLAAGFFDRRWRLK